MGKKPETLLSFSAGAGVVVARERKNDERTIARRANLRKPQFCLSPWKFCCHCSFLCLVLFPFLQFNCIVW
jgi:hypothetical protein